MNTAAADIFKKTEQVIERLGWCQESFGDSSSPVCLFKALTIAIASDYVFADAYSTIRAATGYESIIAYNDEPGRTKEQVIDMLRKCSTV